MMREKGLYFNVGEVLTGRTDAKTFEIDYSLEDYRESDITITSPVKGSVSFVPTDGGVLGSFSVAVSLKMLCSIDGEEFENPMQLTFHHQYRKGASADESPINPDNSLDVAPVIWDEIIVSIPMRPLCKKHQNS